MKLAHSETMFCGHTQPQNTVPATEYRMINAARQHDPQPGKEKEIGKPYLAIEHDQSTGARVYAKQPGSGHQNCQGERDRLYQPPPAVIAH